MFWGTPAHFIARLIVLLVSMSVHEFAHSYGAYLMGDTTAADQGRLTLNPFAHIHWVGFLMFLVAGYGILGTAPVNPYRMRNTRWGMFVAVLAGPASNLILAAICAVPLRFGLAPLSYGGATLDTLIPSPGLLLWEMVYLNVVMFLLNLLPLYPHDGWTVVLSALPPRPAVIWERYRQESMYILFGLIVLSLLPSQFSPLGWIIGWPANVIATALIQG